MCRRSLIFLFALVPLVVTGASCRRRAAQSTIRMADLHAAKQLISGFYDLQAGSWRWTGKEFKVQLAVPRGASENGGFLTLQGTVTPPALEQSGKITITAFVSGSPLVPETIEKPGPFVYRADVSADALRSITVPAEFRVDHTFRAPGDSRDLGVISSVVALHSK
jgi:hypothetical protein